jgi:hypothetical protein
MGAGPQVGGGFTPASISGLVAWFKADAISGKNDGDAISSWTDSSGNTNHAVQATGSLQPLYKTAIQNGKPVVRFDGTDDYVQFGDASALTAGTGFIVAKANADPAAASTNAGLWHLGTHAATPTFYPFTDSNVYDAFGTDSRKSTGNPTPTLAAFNVYTVSSAAGAWTSWFNGTQHFTTATNTVSFPTDPKLGRGIAAGVALLGDIGEFLLYNSALSAGNRQAVEAYLKAKWATP